MGLCCFSEGPFSSCPGQEAAEKCSHRSPKRNLSSSLTWVLPADPRSGARLGVWTPPGSFHGLEAGGPGAHGLYLGSPPGPQESPSSSTLPVPPGHTSTAGHCCGHILLPLGTASSREGSRIRGTGSHAGRQMGAVAPEGAGPLRTMGAGSRGVPGPSSPVQYTGQ